MANYTAEKIALINNNACVIYYNNVQIGVTNVDGHSLSIEETQTEVLTSLYGESPARILKSGKKVTFTMSNKGLHKFDYKTLDNGQGVVDGAGGQATSATDGTAGTIYDRPFVGAAASAPLVIYPIWYDTEGEFGVAGTKYEDTDANPMAWLIPEAVFDGNIEIALSSTDSEAYDLVFNGLVDIANNANQRIQSTGIAPDGTFTPPV